MIWISGQISKWIRTVLCFWVGHYADQIASAAVLARRTKLYQEALKIYPTRNESSKNHREFIASLFSKFYSNI
jgi:hypothetical protein